MPKYTNSTNKYVGGEFLHIPPDTTGFESIYYFSDEGKDFSREDGAPFYNPIKFKQLITFTGISDTTIEFPLDLMGEDCNLIIQTQCSKSIYDLIEIYFNSKDNLPSLPATNSEFFLQIHNRIKRIIVTTAADCVGSVMVLIADKYIPATISLVDSRFP
jgi:hypothetical protein